MPPPFAFGGESRRQLATCHPDLQRVLNRAILLFDFSVIEGHRGEVAQNAAVARGTSRVAWPFGKHNALPSLAADLAPYPVDWRDDDRAHERFVFLAGIVYVCAHLEGVRVRFGIDWNGNLDMRDNVGLHDYGHVELNAFG